jgi:hypothetical protein
MLAQSEILGKGPLVRQAIDLPRQQPGRFAEIS